MESCLETSAVLAQKSVPNPVKWCPLLTLGISKVPYRRIDHKIQYEKSPQKDCIRSSQYRVHVEGVRQKAVRFEQVNQDCLLQRQSIESGAPSDIPALDGPAFAPP